jgi:hypothetical protein
VEKKRDEHGEQWNTKTLHHGPIVNLTPIIPNLFPLTVMASSGPGARFLQTGNAAGVQQQAVVLQRLMGMVQSGLSQVRHCGSLYSIP